MAIIKRIRKSGIRYQVRIRGSDGLWISQTFERKAEAEQYEAKLIHQRRSGMVIRNVGNHVSVNDYFLAWDEETRNNGVSKGWRADQIRYFNTYVGPLIGQLPVQKVTPVHVSRVLSTMSDLGRSEQMQLHVYNILHKMFEDAVDLFEVLSKNPVIKRLRPSVPVKEARYLSLPDVRRLLEAVKGSWVEPGVWLQLLAGLRIGEVQALAWESVDLVTGKLLVAATYVRKEKRIKDYPKGGEQHRISMPEELWNYLRELKKESRSRFVLSCNSEKMADYDWYYFTLRERCKSADVPWVGTHGLRHSTSEIYLAHGATSDDVRKLFAHSSQTVTDRYIHDRGSRLESVSKVIRLFGERVEESGCSPNVPHSRKSDTG